MVHSGVRAGKFVIPLCYPGKEHPLYPRGRAATRTRQDELQTCSWHFRGLSQERTLHSQCWDLMLRNLLFSGVRQMGVP